MPGFLRRPGSTEPGRSDLGFRGAGASLCNRSFKSPGTIHNTRRSSRFVDWLRLRRNHLVSDSRPGSRGSARDPIRRSRGLGSSARFSGAIQPATGGPADRRFPSTVLSKSRRAESTTLNVDQADGFRRNILPPLSRFLEESRNLLAIGRAGGMIDFHACSPRLRGSSKETVRDAIQHARVRVSSCNPDRRRLAGRRRVVRWSTASAADPASPTPKGEVQHHVFDQSKIFPGTVRDYWVYVPKQYDPAKPACLYVNQDGIQYNAPAVFDELIHKKEMPVTIGVFVMHGRVKAPSGRGARSLQPQLRIRRPRRRLRPVPARGAAARGREEDDRRTAGRSGSRSDGNDRAIGGSSSGAICAFTAAWERPDAFRRVFSAIGTYVGLRGGNDYPTLDPQVRAEADPRLPPGRQRRPEHLRRRLVDGQPGDGAGPRPSPATRSTTPGATAATTASTPPRSSPTPCAGSGRTGRPRSRRGRARRSSRRSSSPAKAGARQAVATKPVADHQGRQLVAEGDGSRSSIPHRAYELIGGPEQDAGGLTLSPDQSLFYAADAGSRWVYSYQVQDDGSLKYGQKYYHLHVPDDADDAGAGGMCVDRDGRLYVATRMGIQVCDQAGRVNAIIPTPGGRADRSLLRRSRAQRPLRRVRRRGLQAKAQDPGRRPRRRADQAQGAEALTRETIAAAGTGHRSSLSRACASPLAAGRGGKPAEGWTS